MDGIAYELNTKTGPVGPCFWALDWPLLDQWCVVRIYTTPDGSCLFHACLNAYLKAYWFGKYRESTNTRAELVAKLRIELADYLTTIYKGSHFELRSQELLHEFSLENMRKELLSTGPIGYGYIELLCNYLGVDLYILDYKTQGLYRSDELIKCATGSRPSIIICYLEHQGHFELVAQQISETDFKTYFDPNSSLIKHLRATLIT